MSERAFVLQDQTLFAALSGDHNPLHVDPIAARRTMFGRVVVHGVHAALWGLEVCLEDRAEPLALRSLRATFQSAIGLGEEVRCIVERLPDQRAEIELQVGGASVAWIELEWVSRRDRSPDALSRQPPERRVCRARSFAEVTNASGAIDLCLPTEEAQRLFPNLLRCLVPSQIAAMLATTRLVGMECPGLHSVFAGLDLAFTDEPADAGGMAYRVTRADDRLSRLSIEVRAPGMSGTLTAFVRPAPREQPDILTLQKAVHQGEFADQNALIIGGSRGLGEVTAKLLSAGGARVTITYLRGAGDAQRVVEEIRRRGGSAACIPFDVLGHEAGPAQRLEEMSSATHLYYFATPYVFAGRRGSFSPGLFRSFCDYYVIGFLETVRMVQSAARDLRAVFYPSSSAVEELPPNMAEYAAAKTAGEVAARLLATLSPALTVHLPRLPRLATDQTATFLPIANLDAAPLLLGQLRELRDRAGPPRPPDGSR